MNAKETLTEWLADGDLERVIAGLRIVRKKLGDKDTAQAVDFQSSRYNHLQNNHLKGLAGHSDYSIELAKIRQSLQKIIAGLPDDWNVEELETVLPTPSDGVTESLPITSDAGNLTKGELRKLLYELKYDEVFRRLLAKAEKFGDDDIYYQVKGLCESWDVNNQILRANPQGVPDFADKQKGILEKATRLNEQMEELSSSDRVTASHPVATLSESAFWKKMGYVAIVAGILGGFAEFCNFINLFPNSSGDSMQLTVYVQDAEGKPIPELQNKGQIIVRFGHDLRDPVIGENGRTNLGEIPSDFRGKEVEIVLVAEGWEPVWPGKKYKMDGGQIYHTVRRDNSLGTIQGIVQTRNGSEFIGGALVMIDHDTTVRTDSLGRFRLLLPEKMHKESYLLTVKKAGFKNWGEIYRPKSTPADIRLEQ